MPSQDKKPRSYLKAIRQDMEELRKKMIEYRKEQQANNPSNRPKNISGGAFGAERT